MESSIASEPKADEDGEDEKDDEDIFVEDVQPVVVSPNRSDGSNQEIRSLP